MAHFWEHTAVRDSAAQKTQLFRICQCGNIEESTPAGKEWKGQLTPVPEGQCGEYEARFPHLKSTE